MKQKMESNNIKAIERGKLRKEIYLIEKNLIIFDELDKLRNPKYFIDQESNNKKAVENAIKAEYEMKRLQAELQLNRRGSFFNIKKEKTRRMSKQVTMKQLLEK